MIDELESKIDILERKIGLAAAQEQEQEEEPTG